MEKYVYAFSDMIRIWYGIATRNPSIQLINLLNTVSNIRDVLLEMQRFAE